MSITVTFSPIYGVVGTVVTVSGTTPNPSEFLTAVTVGGASATHTLYTDGSAIHGTITIPSLSVGLKTIVITGQWSGVSTFADAFTVVVPTAVLTPTSGSTGDEISVAGINWAASEGVQAEIGGFPVTGASISVNGSGVLSGHFHVPSQTDGVKSFTVEGATSGLLTFADFTVVPYHSPYYISDLVGTYKTYFDCDPPEKYKVSYPRSGSSRRTLVGGTIAAPTYTREIHYDGGVTQSCGRISISLPIIQITKANTIRDSIYLAGGNVLFSPDDGTTVYTCVWENCEITAIKGSKSYCSLEIQLKIVSKA